MFCTHITAVQGAYYPCISIEFDVKHLFMKRKYVKPEKEKMLQPNQRNAKCLILVCHLLNKS